MLPAASKARAVSGWVPLLAGWCPTTRARRRPSWCPRRAGWRRPELHPGHPDIVGGAGGQVHTVPDTVALLAGAVTLTEGAALSC